MKLVVDDLVVVVDDDAWKEVGEEESTARKGTSQGLQV